VSDCYLTSSEQFFQQYHVEMRKGYISMRLWWCPLCTRSACL